MEISSILIGAVVLGASLAFVMRPFRAGKQKDVEHSPASILPEARRESVLSALRDLDFDFKTGKVPEEDYSSLRAQLLAQAAQLMQDEQEMDNHLEALIQSRKSRRQATSCEGCGEPLEPGERFCSKCGSPVRTETCLSCGNSIKPGDQFCTSCGSRIGIPMEAAGQA